MQRALSRRRCRTTSLLWTNRSKDKASGFKKISRCRSGLLKSAKLKTRAPFSVTIESNEIRVTDIGQRDWHPRLQIEALHCANQTVEIWRIQLHRNVEIESNALNAVQNAGDATADYKLDAASARSHKHFLKVIFHSQPDFRSFFDSDYRLLI